MLFTSVEVEFPKVMSCNNSQSIHILVADANAMVRELLSDAFKRRRAFRVTGCATTVSEVLHTAATSQIDVALVRAHLADGLVRGLEAVRQLRSVHPRIRSVVLLERSETNLVVDAFRAGAKGVFSRSNESFDALCKCVSRVHSGKIWATNDQLELVMQALANSAPVRVLNWKGDEVLTRQEQRIVQLVANGFTNREIAAELGVSGHTVKNYLFHVFEKLGISTRVELAVLAVKSHSSGPDISVESLEGLAS